MKRNNTNSNPRTRRGATGVRRSLPDQPERELRILGIRPLVLVSCSVVFLLCLATIGALVPPTAPQPHATAVSHEARDTKDRVAPPARRTRRAPAAVPESALRRAAAASPESEFLPGTEPTFLLEDPSVHTPELISPPNPEDSEVTWRNEGEFTDAPDDEDGLDPEAVDDDPNRFDEIGDVELDFEDEEEQIAVNLAGLKEEEGSLQENDEDFRGRDDLAEFKQLPAE
jgi:hypothetical protein